MVDGVHLQQPGHVGKERDTGQGRRPAVRGQGRQGGELLAAGPFAGAVVGEDADVRGADLARRPVGGAQCDVVLDQARAVGPVADVDRPAALDNDAGTCQRGQLRDHRILVHEHAEVTEGVVRGEGGGHRRDSDRGVVAAPPTIVQG